MKNERPARQSILSILKKHGPMTARQVGEILGVTPMGARLHLTAMEKDKILCSNFVRQKAGRPTLLFKLAPRSDRYFPQRYDDIAIDLLRGIEQLNGREQIVNLLQLRITNLIDQQKPSMNNLCFKDKVKKITELREHDGFMSELDDENGELKIIEYNCPFRHLAKEFYEFCQCELEYFSKMLDTPVELADRADDENGQHACIVKINKNGA